MSDQVPLLVSVGIPVYNGGDLLRRALESLVAQTYAHLEIIISDNASTDDTETTCRAFAARDLRISCVRQEVNRGPLFNFDTVLQRARGEYFVWAAHDDVWAPTFIEKNLLVLNKDRSLVASVSQAVFVEDQKPIRLPWWVPAGTRPLRAGVAQNLRSYLLNPGKNARFYGLFRREMLLRCIPMPDYCAPDWAVVVRALALGKFAEVPEPLLFLSVGGASADAAYSLRRMNPPGLGQWLPLWPFSRDMLRLPHVRQTHGILLVLIFLNGLYALVLLKALALRWMRRRKTRAILSAFV